VPLPSKSTMAGSPKRALQEIAAKRLGLLHELVPKAVRVAVLVNPANAPTAEATLRDIPEAARAIGLQIQVLNASTRREIEAAFATLVRERADALFVATDTFFISRRVQFATLAARYGIPAIHSTREEVAAGGLLSYGTDTTDMFHQVGVYTGQILKGARRRRGQSPTSFSRGWSFLVNPFCLCFASANADTRPRPTSKKQIKMGWRRRSELRLRADGRPQP
jgi:putative ABC transport system substrate-binding protein